MYYIHKCECLANSNITTHTLYNSSMYNIELYVTNYDFDPSRNTICKKTCSDYVAIYVVYKEMHVKKRGCRVYLMVYLGLPMATHTRLIFRPSLNIFRK